LIPAERAHLHVAAASHPGMKGKNNEDRYAVSAHRTGGKNGIPSLLAIIADGVGGHRAGEVAAQLAVEMISRAVEESDASQPVMTLHDAIVHASQEIFLQSIKDPAQQGMSTTCVCAWVLGDRLYLASVGDSRVYLIRAGESFQLTTDHTWVQEALESGAITEEEARNHPNAHVIRRHLGSQQQVEPDLRLRLDASETQQESEANQGIQLYPGDRILLCSDGLTDLVTKDEIGEILATYPLEDSVARLVNLANGRGGHDNITLVSLEVPEPEVLPAGAPARTRRSTLAWVLWGLLGLLLAGGVLAGGFYWLQTNVWVEATATSTPAQLIQPSLNPPPVVVPMSTPVITLSPPSRTATATGLSSPTQSPSPAGPQPTYTAWPTSTLPSSVDDGTLNP
jgi:PPM family protein phosphatase